MNGTRYDISAAVGVGNLIATTFWKINLAASWPCSIDIIGRQHPCRKRGKLSLFLTTRDRMLTNCWPQPIPSWESGNDLNSAVCDRFATVGIQARWTDWIDHSSQRAVRAHRTCFIGCSCARAVAARFCEIQCVAIGDFGRSDGCCICGESWDDVKTFLVYKNITVIGCSPLKLTIAEATNLQQSIIITE